MQAYAQSFVLNFNGLALSPEERVVGFDLKVCSGYVSRFLAPPGWQIEINNQPSENVDISGSIFVGSAALSSQDLNKIITITQVSVFGKTLELSGDIVVTKDFSSTRTLTLIPKNIILTPTSQ
jgi:hypothetical protein